MSAIPHCIDTDIEKHRMYWKAKADADFRKKFRMLEQIYIKDGALKCETEAERVMEEGERLSKRIREAQSLCEIHELMEEYFSATTD